MDSETVSRAREDFAAFIERVRITGEPVAVTRHGRPMVVVVPPEWYEAHKGTDGESLLDCA